VVVQVLRLPESDGLDLPAYMTDGAAGADVVAAVSREVVIAPGGRAKIPTGFALAVPPGYEVQVRPRSGLALRFGVTLLNTPGTIDSDYRGEVGIIMINLGDKPYVVRRGERIAQMIVAPVSRARFEPVETLPPTERGSGGFGSTS
jgi:dUTP pyrophosphatase